LHFDIGHAVDQQRAVLVGDLDLDGGERDTQQRRQRSTLTTSPFR
jgi:hypothetical protein